MSGQKTVDLPLASPFEFATRAFAISAEVKPGKDQGRILDKFNSSSDLVVIGESRIFFSPLLLMSMKFYTKARNRRWVTTGDRYEVRRMDPRMKQPELSGCWCSSHHIYQTGMYLRTVVPLYEGTNSKDAASYLLNGSLARSRTQNK
jgi:hypothetical protein